MSTTFADIERERMKLTDERAQRIANHIAWLDKCDARLKVLSERGIVLTKGVDLARVDRARQILEVQGDPTEIVRGSDYGQGRTTVRANAVEDARRCLIARGGSMRTEYIGVKNYAHFGDQRADCEYNFGPRHGCIVFRIGLTKAVRQRDLTDDEIEDALYFLHVWPTIEAAKKEAA